MTLTTEQEARLLDLLRALIDQDEARVIVPANEAADGYWFGGGNLTEDRVGTLWLTGRYRNKGDSRMGLGAGDRGLECALFRSTDGGESFQKAQSWSKADLAGDGPGVLSIEGTALVRRPDGVWELFVSTETRDEYPAEFSCYQKPGTGVWRISSMTGPSPSELDASTLTTILRSQAPEDLHVKDPVVFADGEGITLVYCSHPISWASSNTGRAYRPAGRAAFEVTERFLVDRGSIWDVAATRVTDRFLVPKVGAFEGTPEVAVLFYDGAESLRQLDENPNALKRARGYSCEELGGALWCPADDLASAERLSRVAPLFLSPHGSRSSRYVSVARGDSRVFATWQQAQADGSQPLVMNSLANEEVAELLGA